MYIEKTTAEDRLVIETVLDGIFLQIDKAHFIIMDVLETYFMEREQKDLYKFDAERAGVYIRTAADMIFDALLQYYLTVGQYDWRGVEPHLQSAERASKAISVNKAIEKCFDAQKIIGRGTERAAAMQAQLRAAYSLPDDQAAPLIEKIAKG